MDGRVLKQVEGIHRSPAKVVIVMAGGGAQALGWLLSVPGASRTVLEVQVPYSAAALTQLLGAEPGRVVSAETSRDMARAAFGRAGRLGTGGGPLVGIGCTAAIATDHPKRGEHRCFVSAWTGRRVTTYGVEFVKGLRDRIGEDEICSRLVLCVLAEASDVVFGLPMGLDERETLEVVRSEHSDPIRQLFEGLVTTVTVRPDGDMVAEEPRYRGILPGSFDPLHRGHEALASVAARLLEADVSYELSIANVDKPPLEEAEVRRRLAQFVGERPVVLTRAPVFHEKARLFPGCTFVVGWDTALRLVLARYYGGDESEMLGALSEVRRLGCRFLVAGRLDQGQFHTLDDIPVPTALADMFTGIPESTFRCDLSSTELRLASG